jgi:hypothetical protein
MGERMSMQSKRLPVVNEPPKRWDYRKWATLQDPAHKSHLSSLVGPHACLMQFKYDRTAELMHVERETCSGKTEMGSAVHEAIARALRNETLRDSILAGKPASSPERVHAVILEEFDKATAGREVRWYGKSEREKALSEAAAMVLGLFADMHRYVAKVELVEAGFIVKLGELWLEGHTDLIYRPAADPTQLAFTDWKTGATKPHQIKLDHGYESGFYAHALAEGTFLPTTVVDLWRELANQERIADVPLDPWDAIAIGKATSERTAMHLALRAVAKKREDTGVLVEGAVRFERFPEVIRLTHLRDYIPYAKKGDKAITRPEDLEFWSRTLGREVQPGDKIKYESGQWRGGAWLDVKRRADDVTRLEKMLRSVVSWIRFGRFVAVADEMCTRCPYRGPCLTSGYELDKDDAKQLREALRGIDTSDADALSVDD